MRLILQISLRLNASKNSLNRWIDGKYEKEHFQKIRFKEGAIGILLAGVWSKGKCFIGYESNYLFM